jgi:hypothetical protein
LLLEIIWLYQKIGSYIISNLKARATVNERKRLCGSVNKKKVKKYVVAGREVMLLKSIIHWDISDLSRGLKVLYKARKGHLS